MSVYTYIIVGAGSAGSVLANRLSQNSSHRVLLIEAGGDNTSPLISTPGFWGALQDTQFDWGYRTTPQVHINGRRISSP